jgi:hypothetical protein
MRAALAVLLAVVLGARFLAQTPARDAPALAVSGTGSISGTVVSDDDTRAPLKRAQVTLSRTGLEDIRTSSTDQAGRFAFNELPAGTYVLRAGKGGYLGTSYGAVQTGMPGSAIPLRDGERFTATPMTLVKGAVLAGRILDSHGRPALSTSVEAIPIVTVNGERRRRQTSDRSGIGSTNAHGEYRLFGLPPGEYVLFANSEIQPRIPTTMTPGDIAWAQKPAGTPPAREPRVAYARTVFPGTADLAAAVVISLSRGEERTGLDFTIQNVPVARVSGVVTDADGRPAPAVYVQRLPRQPSLIFNELDPGVRSSNNGTFTLVNVPPGEFTLMARGAPANTAPVINPVNGRGSVPQTWWSLTDLTVSGSDLADFELRLQPGLSLIGRIEFKNTMRPPPSPLPRVRVTLIPKVPGTNGGGVFTATSGTDGTFRMDGLLPGTFLVSSRESSETWAVRSITHSGRDFADLPLEIRVGDDLSDLVVTLSDQMAGLSGTLTDRGGRPTPQFYVLMFPTDRTLWTQSSRRIQAVRADVRGTYTIAGLPAGEYYVAAATAIESTMQYEPAYLEQFVPVAIKMAIGEGEKKVQDMRIGG